MDLILISCSGSKKPGGTKAVQYQNHISDCLSIESNARLNTLRQDLASQIGENPGLDIGSEQANKEIIYMPAYQRYTGVVYQNSDFEKIFPKIKDLQILIISAFYGIVDANDFIREYNWQMDNGLRNGRKTNTWWKNYGLGELVLEIVEKLNPTHIYDFLFGKYRSAIVPFYRLYKGNDIIMVDTQPGFGSLAKTGLELKKVLREYIKR